MDLPGPRGAPHSHTAVPASPSRRRGLPTARPPAGRPLCEDKPPRSAAATQRPTPVGHIATRACAAACPCSALPPAGTGTAVPRCCRGRCRRLPCGQSAVRQRRPRTGGCRASSPAAGPGRAGPEPAGRRARPFGQRGAGPPARAQQSGGGGGSGNRVSFRGSRARAGSPSAAQEENPARLIPLAAQNVNCQHFTTVAVLLCPDSAGEMERIRSALQVRAIKVKEETWTKQDKATSLLRVFRSLPRSISSLNVNCQHFTTVALLLCPDSAGEMERIRSASRVRGTSS
ncbi:uncharacterized protein LOC141743125 [Larus michahellis]|uniref:uncharacterized protein LOC141743125 n=1 Tax=Larus michahellis TaxID=119627 RepID=UPI003D9B4AEF